MSPKFRVGDIISVPGSSMLCFVKQIHLTRGAYMLIALADGNSHFYNIYGADAYFNLITSIFSEV